MTKPGGVIIKIGAIAAVLGSATFISLNIISARTPHIPAGFLEARARGSVLAENIVTLSRESLANLKKISEADKAGKYSDGIDLIIAEISRNQIARNTALSLSKELEAMALALNEVRPKEAQNLGLQAIISESQVVQRLISYNGYTYQLLEALKTRFINRGSSGAEVVGDLLKKMNDESLAINDLNGRYKDLMNQFDSLTARKG